MLRTRLSTRLCAGMLGLAAVSATAATEPPYGIAQRPVLAPLNFPADGPQPGQIAVVNAFPNLSFRDPLFLTTAPGDPSRMFVVGQNGFIYVFPKDPAARTRKVFLDISARITNLTSEEGLLGLAFDPAYQTNGYFYVNYTYTSGNLKTRVARFKVSANPDVADPASETSLLEFDQPYTNHNGGWIGFGPDGRLYIAAGDGGAGGDPQNNAQNLNVLLGKTLRINKDGSIPADNPFAGQAGKRGEIWSYGMRNPFRMSFDRATGVLWAGDVGQNLWEEIDLITRGGNYGWRVREGNHDYNNPDGQPASNFIAPIAEYDHNDGRCSITGGYVYRGSAVTALAGRYVYTDYCAGTLWMLNGNTPGATSTVIGQIPGNPTSFGEDAAGELYVTSKDGHVYQIVNGSGGGGSLPALLSQTGLFIDTAGLTPNPGLIEYDINAPFWSDGARKRRWMAIPNGTTIGFDAKSAWTFPRGAVTVKHFEITLANGSSKRLETRVFVNQTSGWAGYTYRWNDAGTDATLLNASETVTLQVADPSAPGGSRSQLYEFPSRSACLSCHTAAAGFVLGPRTAQLNKKIRYPGGVADNQLRTDNHIGLFSTDIGVATQYSRLSTPSDSAQGLTARARAYLETNCAQCHQPGGPTPVDLDLRALTAMKLTRTLNVAPTEGDLGLAGAVRIKPGRKESSVLWERMRRLDASRMPPIASHVVDADGVALIGSWIDAGAH